MGITGATGIMGKVGKVIRSLAVIGVGLISALSGLGEVRWLEKSYDFGLMHEEAGPQGGSVRFVNEGAEPVALFSVRPSCGCTSAHWSDAPVAPGDTALIAFTYDPTLRPGKFDKSIKVRFAEGPSASIRITGNVLGTPESLASLYPVEAGHARLSDSVLDFGRITESRTPTAFVNAYILGPDSLAPEVIPGSKALKAILSSESAGPGDIITCSVTLDARKAAKYGPVSIPLEFQASDDDDFTTVDCRAFITPDPKRLLGIQQGKNPRLHVTVSVDPRQTVLPGGGKLTKKKEQPVEFIIGAANIGKGPLEIYGAFTPIEGAEAELPAKPVKPGKKDMIRITIPADRLPQDMNAVKIPVEIISNDPDQPVLKIVLSLNK